MPTLTELLDELDLRNLASFGAPRDAYASEPRLVMELVRTCATVDAFARALDRLL